MRKLMTAAVLAATALAVAGCAERVVYAPPPPPPAVYVPPPPPPVYVPPPRVYPGPVCRWRTTRVVQPDGTVVVRRVRICR